MSSRRIFVPKLNFLQFWVDSGPGYPKMAGCKFFDPSTPYGGHLGLGTPPELTRHILIL